jgi:hypothetical protein
LNRKKSALRDATQHLVGLSSPFYYAEWLEREKLDILTLTNPPHRMLFSTSDLWNCVLLEIEASKLALLLVMEWGKYFKARLMRTKLHAKILNAIINNFQSCTIKIYENFSP